MKDYIDQITVSATKGGLPPIQAALSKLYAKYDLAKAASPGDATITAAEKEFNQQLQNLYFYNAVGKTKTDELI